MSFEGGKATDPNEPLREEPTPAETPADAPPSSAEVRDVLRLALPLIISSLSWTVMNFIDRAMLFGYSHHAVGAALSAGMTFFALITFPWAMASYVNTFVAQYHGAQRLKRIGPAVWQGVAFALLAWPLVMSTIPLAPQIFALFGHSDELSEMELIYFRVNCWGSFPLMAAAALSSFFTGRGQVRVVALVDSVAAAANVVLDYAWIYGNWGFEPGGISGAAWATVCAMWIKFLIYTVLFLRPRANDQFATWSWQFDGPLFRRVLRYGLPNGLQTFVEVGGYTVFVLLIGRLGDRELAASSLALNINNLAFMPVWGIGLATSTVVGQFLGQDRPDLATRGTWSALKIASVYMGSMCLLYLLAPDVVLLAHHALERGEHDKAMRDTVVVLLRFAAGFGLCDAACLIFSGALKGAGDTMFILYVNLVMATLPVLLTFVGIEWFNGGLIWAWIMLSAWIGALAVIFTLRFLFGPWRSMRVIEEPAVP